MTETAKNPVLSRMVELAGNRKGKLAAPAVLKDGRVAESGAHEELCREKGQYFRMWQEQKKATGWTFESSVRT